MPNGIVEPVKKDSGKIVYTINSGHIFGTVGGQIVILEPGNDPRLQAINNELKQKLYTTDADGKTVFKPDYTRREVIQAIHNTIRMHLGEYDKLALDAANGRSTDDISSHLTSRDGSWTRPYLIGADKANIKDFKEGSFICTEFAPVTQWLLQQHGFPEAQVMRGYTIKDLPWLEKADLNVGNVYVYLPKDEIIVEAIVGNGVDPVYHVQDPAKLLAGEPVRVTNEAGKNLWYSSGFGKMDRDEFRKEMKSPDPNPGQIRIVPGLDLPMNQERGEATIAPLAAPKPRPGMGDVKVLEAEMEAAEKAKQKPSVDNQKVEAIKTKFDKEYSAMSEAAPKAGNQAGKPQRDDGVAIS